MNGTGDSVRPVVTAALDADTGAGPLFDGNPDNSQLTAELHARLSELTSDGGARPLTRRNAINLLRVISECLGPPLSETIGLLETGEQIVTDHRAVNLLNELIDALRDLDSGKTHPTFKPARHGANRSLSTQQLKLDNVWLDTVLIVQRSKGLAHRKDAEKLVARTLTMKGKTRNGQPITAQLLKSLRDRQRYRKRR
jgi:hypothetical protein